MRMLGYDDGFWVVTRWIYHKPGFCDLVMELACV